MGGKSTSSKTKVENEPPEWARPAFEKGGKELLKWFKSDDGFNTYDGSTVANLSGTTKQALVDLTKVGDSKDYSQAMTKAQDAFTDASKGKLGPTELDEYGNLRDAALKDKSLQQLTNLAGNIKGEDVRTNDIRADKVATNDIKAQSVATNAIKSQSVGANDVASRDVSASIYNPVDAAAQQLQGTADRLLGGIAGGQQGIGTEADYRKILGAAEAPTAAGQNLAEMASGRFLAEGNPYFNKVLDRQSEDLANNISSLFSGGGRYGSTAHQGTVGKEVGGMRNQALSDQWNRDQAAMLDANRMIDASNSQQIANRMGAVGGISDVQGQNISNRMGASDSIIGANETALGATQASAAGRAGLETGNADRSLDALGLKKSVQTNDADRALEALGLKTSTQVSNADRAMEALGLKTSTQISNADRTLEALGLEKSVATGNADRALEAQGLKSSTLATASGLEGQNEARALQAQQGLNSAQMDAAGLRLSGANNLQSLADQILGADMTKAGAQLAAGQIRDEKAQQKLDDEVARFYQGDMQAINRISALLSGGVTAASNYGTQTTNQTMTQPFNPMSIFGAIAPLMSDAREKQDVELIGETIGGHGLYAFRYRDGISRGPERPDGKNVGVMAQEVALTRPDLVHPIDGVLHVDYSGVL